MMGRCTQSSGTVQADSLLLVGPTGRSNSGITIIVSAESS